jgi:hypothetical protein
VPAAGWGDVVKIPEAQYLSGLGDLVLRVTGVGAVQRLPEATGSGSPGVQLAWNGTEVRKRDVLVRPGGLMTQTS